VCVSLVPLYPPHYNSLYFFFFFLGLVEPRENERGFQILRGLGKTGVLAPETLMPRQPLPAGDILGEPDQKKKKPSQWPLLALCPVQVLLPRRVALQKLVIKHVEGRRVRGGGLAVHVPEKLGHAGHACTDIENVAVPGDRSPHKEQILQQKKIPDEYINRRQVQLSRFIEQCLSSETIK
jgi:hypothetical protein